MRLGTISGDGGPQAVVVRDGDVVAVNGYEDVGALLRAGEDGLAAAVRVSGSPAWKPTSIRWSPSSPAVRSRSQQAR